MPSKKEIDFMLGEYNDWLEKYGDNFRSLGWTRDSSNRFEALLTPWESMLRSSNLSVLDYGCGLGHIIPSLLKYGFSGRYIGLDINPNLIAMAKKNYPTVQFYTLDEMNEIPYVDLTLISGLFNRKFSDSTQFLEDTIKRLVPVTNIGLSFNALSEFALRKHQHNHYTRFQDLYKLIDRELVDKFILDSASVPGEFTVHLFK